MTSRRHRKIRQLIFPLWSPRANRHRDPFWLLLIPSIPKIWKMWGSFGSHPGSRDIVSHWTAEYALAFDSPGWRGEELSRKATS
jgi:hypothetical protein